MRFINHKNNSVITCNIVFRLAWGPKTTRLATPPRGLLVYECSEQSLVQRSHAHGFLFYLAVTPLNTISFGIELCLIFGLMIRPQRAVPSQSQRDVRPSDLNRNVTSDQTSSEVPSQVTTQIVHAVMSNSWHAYKQTVPFMILSLMSTLLQSCLQYFFWKGGGWGVLLKRGTENGTENGTEWKTE